MGIRPKVRRMDDRWLGTCRPRVREEWGVRQHPGLRVRVGPREASFYYYSTAYDSTGKAKRKAYRLGRWPEVSLSEAAAEVQRLKAAGPERRESRTVNALLQDFELEVLVHQKKGHEVAASLRLHAVGVRPVRGAPPLGEWKVAAVQKAHLVDLVRLAKVKGSERSRRWGGPGAARALASALRVLFAHAESTGLAVYNVAEALESSPSLPRDIWLQTPAEVAAFFEAVDLRALLAGKPAPSSTSAAVRLALAFQALVPVRKEASRTMSWAELDLTIGTWTLPTSRQKAPSEAHRRKMRPMVVKLPPTALAILQTMRRLSPVGGELVFPSPRDAGRPVSEQTLIGALVRFQSDGRLLLAPDAHGTPRRLTVHDLRRTWASWAASDAVGANPLAVELVLGHSLAKAVGLSSTFRTYVHSDIAARDQAKALADVDAFYKKQWAKPAAKVRRLALGGTA